jgi:NAD(P)-dependent dehydrogenase (short-subunit alcohol dehydrogenase family)
LGASYLAAKAAVEQLTMDAGPEFAPLNIGVNCFKPYKGILTKGARAWMPPNVGLSAWGAARRWSRRPFLARQDAQGVTASIAFDQEIIAWHGL